MRDTRTERMSGVIEVEENVMNVSASPHIFSKDSVRKIMWTVNLTLLPATIFAVVHFGISALNVILTGILSAVFFEIVVLKLRKRNIATVLDGSAFLTGLLLAMCLPPTVPLFIPVVGSFAAIVVAKQSMGGLGYNIFNPAHVGRAVVMASWPMAMTTWTSMKTSVDAVTTATPLGILKHQGYDEVINVFGTQSQMYWDLFLGNRNGCIGETSVVLLLCGGLFLIFKGYIKWFVPLCMIGTVGILTWIFGPKGFFTGDPLFHMMAGGLVIGAFFMITDMVTTPITARGQVIFAVGAGAITVLIRLLGGYPEGVCYSILLMNSATPLIDRFIKPYGLKNKGGK